jgi:hypothetical protein
MRIGLLASLPGETLGRLAERMERRELGPGEAFDASGQFGVVITGMLKAPEGVLRPGDTFSSQVTAVTPATVASCEQAAFDELVS